MESFWTKLLAKAWKCKHVNSFLLSEHSRKQKSMSALCKSAELHAILDSTRHALFYTKLIPLDSNFCLTTGLKWHCKWMLNGLVCKDWKSENFSYSSMKNKAPFLRRCNLQVPSYYWWQDISPSKSHPRALALSSRSCPHTFLAGLSL